MSRTSYRKL